MIENHWEELEQEPFSLSWIPPAPKWVAQKILVQQSGLSKATLTYHLHKWQSLALIHCLEIKKRKYWQQTSRKKSKIKTENIEKQNPEPKENLMENQIDKMRSRWNQILTLAKIQSNLQTENVTIHNQNPGKLPLWEEGFLHLYEEMMKKWRREYPEVQDQNVDVAGVIIDWNGNTDLRQQVILNYLVGAIQFFVKDLEVRFRDPKEVMMRVIIGLEDMIEDTKLTFEEEFHQSLSEYVTEYVKLHPESDIEDDPLDACQNFTNKYPQTVYDEIFSNNSPENEEE